MMNEPKQCGQGRGMAPVALCALVAILLVACSGTETEPTGTLTAMGTPTPTPAAPTSTPLPATQTPEPTADTSAPVLEGLVDVGGYGLYIHCEGDGSPTVILESDLGKTKSEWSKIQSIVGARTRVCAYDRAGTGWSDPAPTLPRTSQDMVKDLHTLLVNAHIQGPYVLVAHRIGGLNAQLYASQFPQEVAGLVLVDSWHPDWPEEALQLLPPEASDESNRLTERRQVLSALLNDAQKTSVYWDGKTSIAQVSAAGALGDLPLIVLSRDPSDLSWIPFYRGATYPLDVAERSEQSRLQRQKQLAELSSYSEFIVAEGSGYPIVESGPEIVTDAILTTVDMVRQELGITAATPHEGARIVMDTPEPHHSMVWVTGNPGYAKGLCANFNRGSGSRRTEWLLQNAAFLTICDETGARCNLPGLASSWEQSEDHTTWTFHLREDVTWSDGTPSTADDHIFTLNVSTHPDFGAQTIGRFQDVLGFQEYQDGEADHLAGVHKIDDHTFSLTFVDGTRREPAQFSDYYLLPHHRMKDRTVQEWIDHPVEDRLSVGPYYFVESVCGDHHTLRANPYFYLGKPQIEEWIFRVMPDSDERVASLVRGEIDVQDVTTPDDIPHLTQVEHLNIVPDAEAKGFSFWLNQNSLPLKVRRAMQKSVDRQGIIDRLGYGGWTYPCPAQPQGVPLEGVIPDFNLYDPDEAGALLEEAVAEGWDPDTEIRLYYYYRDEFTAHQMATVADTWETIGINAKPEFLPPEKVVEVFYEKDDYDVMYGCCADAGNREHFTNLYPYYKGGLTWPDGWNGTRVDIPELDAALETINETFDRGEEIAAYQTACTILGEQVVNMPLWMSPPLFTVNSRLKNTVAPNGMFNKYVHTWWIEE